jgi:hypothetical protein
VTGSKTQVVTWQDQHYVRHITGKWYSFSNKGGY